MSCKRCGMQQIRNRLLRMRNTTKLKIDTTTVRKITGGRLKDCGMNIIKIRKRVK
jgi:hypothetical protein